MWCGFHAASHQCKTGKRQGLLTPQSLYQQEGDASAIEDEVLFRGFIASQCSDIKSNSSGSFKDDLDGGDEGGFDNVEDVSDEDVHEEDRLNL